MKDVAIITGPSSRGFGVELSKVFRDLGLLVDCHGQPWYFRARTQAKVRRISAGYRCWLFCWDSSFDKSVDVVDFANGALAGVPIAEKNPAGTILFAQVRNAPTRYSLAERISPFELRSWYYGSKGDDISQLRALVSRLGQDLGAGEIENLFDARACADPSESLELINAFYLQHRSALSSTDQSARRRVVARAEQICRAMNGLPVPFVANQHAQMLYSTLKDLSKSNGAETKKLSVLLPAVSSAQSVQAAKDLAKIINKVTQDSVARKADPPPPLHALIDSEEAVDYHPDLIDSVRAYAIRTDIKFAKIVDGGDDDMPLLRARRKRLQDQCRLSEEWEKFEAVVLAPHSSRHSKPPNWVHRNDFVRRLVRHGGRFLEEVFGDVGHTLWKWSIPQSILSTVVKGGATLLLGAIGFKYLTTGELPTLSKPPVAVAAPIVVQTLLPASATPTGRISGPLRIGRTLMVDTATNSAITLSNGQVVIWATDGSKREPVRLSETGQQVARFANDAHWVLTGSQQGTVAIWNSESGEQLASAPLAEDDAKKLSKTRIKVGKKYVWKDRSVERPIADVASISGKTARIFAAGKDGRLRVFSFDGKSLDEGDPQRGVTGLTAVAAMTNGLVLFGDDTGHLFKWNVESPTTGRLEMRSSRSSVLFIRVVKNEKWVLVGYGNGVVDIYDVSSLNPVASIRLPSVKPISADISDDFAWAVVSANDGALHFWDIGAAKELFPRNVYGGEGHFRAKTAAGSCCVLDSVIIQRERPNAPNVEVLSGGDDGRVVRWAVPLQTSASLSQK